MSSDVYVKPWLLRVMLAAVMGLSVLMAAGFCVLGVRLAQLEETVAVEHQARMAKLERMYDDIEHVVVPTLKELSDDIRISARVIRKMRDDLTSKKEMEDR